MTTPWDSLESMEYLALLKRFEAAKRAAIADLFYSLSEPITKPNGRDGK